MCSSVERSYQGCTVAAMAMRKGLRSHFEAAPLLGSVRSAVYCLLTILYDHRNVTPVPKAILKGALSGIDRSVLVKC